MTASVGANAFAIGARVVLGLLGVFSAALGAGFLFIVIARPHDDSRGTRMLVALMGVSRVVAGLSFVIAAVFSAGVFVLVGGIVLVVGYGGTTILQWVAKRLGIDVE